MFESNNRGEGDMKKPDMRPHVLANMHKKQAITKAPGGYRVNDLNPSNGIQNFGVSKTKGEALRHLRAIEYFKHKG